MKARWVHCMAAVAVLVSLTPAFAGWEWFATMPYNAQYSHAYACDGGSLQVGAAALPYRHMNGEWQFRPHAVVWNGATDGYYDLTPGSWSSSARDTDGNHVVGQVDELAYMDHNLPVYETHAALWTGSGHNWTFTKLSGARSAAYGVHGTDQVGYWYSNDPSSPYVYYNHAAMWHGTPDSVVNLTPSWSQDAIAYDVWGDQQVGYAKDTTSYRVSHAVLWTGSAASCVDLNPGQGYSSSATSVYDGWQGGWVHQSAYHAAVWNGSAASWRDLNPSWARSSQISGMCSGWQSGYACATADGATDHAVVWNGTAGSAVDLHSLLGPDWTKSQAYGISRAGDEVWVVGDGWVTGFTSPGSVVWHYTPDVVPEPSSMMVFGSGFLALVGLICRRK